jgi:hypothetical protein
MVQEFYKTYGYYFIKVWCIHILAILGFFILDNTYIAIGLIVGVLFWHLYGLVFHDWISHEYIKPRNRLFTWLMLFVFYSQDNMIRKKKNYHVYHHKHWKDRDVDPTCQKLEGLSLFRYLFSLHKPVAQNIPEVTNSILETNRLVRILDAHSRKLYFASIIVLWAILPFAWFFIAAVYVPWTIMIIANYHDYFFHGPMQGQDRSILTLIFSCQAWHIEHHTHWHTEYYGPGYWYLINPTWYYRKLFFIAQ